MTQDDHNINFGDTVMAKRKRTIRAEKLLALQGGLCFYCSCHLTPSEATFDHLLPHSHGGPDNNYNVVMACFECNQFFDNSSIRLKILWLLAFRPRRADCTE